MKTDSSYNSKEFVERMVLELRKQTEKCQSIEDFLDLAYSFRFDGYSIAPTQKRNEIRTLLEVLIKEQPKSLLEIGTSNGGTLFLLCAVASSDANIISVDLPEGPFGGNLFPDWKMALYHSFAKKTQKIHLVRSDSHDFNTFNHVKELVGDRPLDFLLIDGDHNYDGVKKDFEMYRTLVSEGGLIAFHDINPGPQSNGGDVSIFWKNVSQEFPFTEIVFDPDIENYGIGVLVHESKKKSTKSLHVIKTIDILKKKFESQPLSEKKHRIENTPLGLLLTIYSKRLDLIESFPEVAEGNYKNLIKWAIEVTNENQADYAKEQLIKFLPWYQKYLDEDRQKQKISLLDKQKQIMNPHPMGVLFYLYSSRPDLQKNFPEVSDGNYQNLLNWATNTSINDIGTTEETGLIEKYRSFYQQELQNIVKNNLLVHQKQEAEQKASLLDAQKQEAEQKASLLDAQKQEAEQKASLLDAQKQEAEQKASLLDAQKQEAEQKASLLDAQNKIIHKNLEKSNQQLGKLQDNLSKVTNENNLIKNSLAWLITQKLNRFITKYFPPNSRRGRLVFLAVRFTKASLDKGLHSASKMAKSELEQKGISVFSKDASSIYSIRLKQNLQYEKAEYEKMKLEVKEFKYKPLISIVMPVYNVDKKWLNLAVESVLSQIYENWELCMVDDGSTEKHIKSSLQSYAKRDGRIKIAFLEKNQGIAIASNKAMSMTSGEFVGLLDNDDELYQNSLFEVVKLLNANKNLDIVYSDENHVNEKGDRIDPFYKPDYSPDLLMCCHYMAHFIVFRKKFLEQLGFFRLGFDGAQDYDLILRAVEKTNRIGHVQKLLYGWRNISSSVAGNLNAKPYANLNAAKAIKDALIRRGLKGEPIPIKELGYFHVKYEIIGNPLVSLIIVTHDRIDLLDRLLESIETKSTYKNYEIIIVDRKSEKAYTLDYLSKLKHKIVRYEHELNISDAINFGANYAKGKYLIYMNDDLEVISPDWIESMLEHCQRKEVGIAGCCLVYPNSDETRENIISETIQHAGIVLGIGGIAGHAFRHVSYGENGYYALNKTIRNYNGVTGACAMIRRDVFDEVGGYDTNLKVSYMDVDLCLRVREKGYLIVYTPYAQLYHYESATRRKLDPPEDAKFLVKRWNQVLMKRDPYYNMNLSLLAENFTPSFCPIPVEITPLALLLEMYWARDDLPRAFPEVKQGNYANLIRWAATYGISSKSYGLPDDQHGSILRYYQDWYVSNANTNDSKILLKPELIDLK